LTKQPPDVDRLGQAGDEASASQGAVGFAVPDGLTYADLREAARFIESYGDEMANEAVFASPSSCDDDPCNEEIKIAARVFEFLAGAVARNSKIR
jgi:hypothetical protein